jgi:ATP-dependent DNA helicase RecQ
MGYSTSLSAGFVLDSLAKEFDEEDKKIAKSVCRLSLQSNVDLSLRDNKPVDRSILSVYKNIISRGFPTYSSLFVEEKLGSIYGKDISFEEISNENEYSFQLDQKYKPQLISTYTCFDPRCESLEKDLSEFKGSKPAKEFYDSLPLHVKQFTKPERYFDDGLMVLDKEEKFYRRQVDFAIETPTGLKWIIEIDGKQHNKPSNQVIDKIRDEALYDSGWKVVRISASQVSFDNPKFKRLKDELANDITIQRAKEHMETPLWQNEGHFDALHISLSPIAIAQAQCALIEGALAGNIDLQANQLKLLVYERDVAFALIAMEDMFNWLKHLYQLKGIVFKKPEVSINVVISSEFERNVEYYNEQFALQNIDQFTFNHAKDVTGSKQYDIVLDLSVLEKRGLRRSVIPNEILKETGVYFNIRQTYNMTPTANIEGATPMGYSATTQENLRFFLRQIFRKKEFRPGQLEILERSLSGRDTIGLLPTGGGKSLCYQLATLLQPGIALIIEPLKALMADQERNLKNYLIDHCVYINSDIDAERRKEIEKRWARSEFQYIWISPERLQIEEFRNYLQILSTKMPIAYAVIDEAHCVSEWGHDFRTSYLMMSKTIRNYCEYEGIKPTFYALTATASEVVLKDVVKELLGNTYEGNPIVRSSKLDREKLKIKIYTCPSSGKFDQFKKAIWDICNEFSIDTNELFLPEGKNTKSGLVFCPHVNSTDYSIDKLSSNIAQHYNFDKIKEIKEPEPPTCQECQVEMVPRNGRYGKFWGCTNYPRCSYTEQYSGGEMSYYDRMHMFGGKAVSGFDKGAWDEYKITAQREYVEDKVPLMVSTKAFGMGIDKPNIRYTIHYNIPSSLEAFYQEAGRAGRDGKDAINAVIFSDDSLQDAKDRLSPKRSAAEVREMKDIPRSDEGDVHRMLFFQNLSFEGFEQELKSIRKILNYNLAETYESLKEGNSKTIVLEGRGRNTEKAIYRLSLIGFVTDYTIEFSYPRVYHVTIKKEDFKTYSDTLYDYIQRHGVTNQDDTASQENFYSYVKSKNRNHFITKCCAVLLDYIYATIEPQRRRALLNLVNALESGDPAKFRTDMLRLLNPNEVLNTLFNDFPNSDSIEIWAEILKEANSEDNRNKLLGIALRYLESYPNSIGLLLIAATLRLSLAGEDAAVAQDDFETALDEIDNSRFSSNTESVIKIFLEYLFENGSFYPKTVFKIIRSCSNYLDSRAFDNWIYRNSKNNKVRELAAEKLSNTAAQKTEDLLLKLNA